jgi:hypothetical protein
MAERAQSIKRQHEVTRKLVEEIENNVNPISQAIMDIWQKLPPDVLDRQLAVPPKPRQN